MASPCKAMKVSSGGNHQEYFNIAKVRPSQPRKTLQTQTSEPFLISLMGKGNAGNNTWQRGGKWGRALRSWKSCAKGQRQQVSSAGEPVVAQAKEKQGRGICTLVWVHACVRWGSRKEVPVMMARGNYSLQRLELIKMELDFLESL